MVLPLLRTKARLSRSGWRVVASHPLCPGEHLLEFYKLANCLQSAAFVDNILTPSAHMSLLACLNTQTPKNRSSDVIFTRQAVGRRT